MMYPKLLHIYGPLYINSYGIAIALGLALFMWLVRKDTIIRKYISYEQLQSLVLFGILSGVVGGRLLYLINNWHEHANWYDLVALWDGGLSILGTVLGVLASTIGYLWYHHIPLLPVTDRLAIYIPLTQAVGRLGCFVAGCCHGTVAHTAWAVTYTQHDSFAPLYVPLHPTQLYSAVFLVSIFYVLRCAQYRLIAPGQLTMLYLALIGTERFIIDFWRGDRVFFATNMLNLSVHQWLSGGIVIGACMVLGIAFLNNKKAHPTARPE